MYVMDVTDRACACIKSVRRLGVDKDHRTKIWELILYHTCTTIELNCRQELKIVYLFVITWMSKSMERRSTFM